MLIYKIFRAAELADLIENGTTKGAPVDLTDGFVHFSTADQLEGTLKLHFAGEEDLTLLAVEADTLGDDLKWEPSRGGALFPHLFRELRAGDIVWQRALTRDEKTGAHVRIWE